MDERERVWEGIFTTMRKGGTIADAAKKLDMSTKTLYRRINQFNLYPDIDRHNLLRHRGPPRGGGPPVVASLILLHIKKNKGEVDYGRLAMEIYNEDNHKTRTRIYTALTELKSRGVIAVDSGHWFILNDRLLT